MPRRDCRPRGLASDAVAHDDDQPGSPTAAFHAMALAAVERELAALEASDRAGRLPPGQRRSANSISSVFTLRLDHDERVALEARAAALDVKPSALARSLIRRGLMRSEITIDEALDRIEAAVAELRARCR